MTRLRFCFLTTFYPPYSFGGDATAVQHLARGLVNAGHHVTVIHDIDAFAALSNTPLPTAAVQVAGLEVVSLRSGLGSLSLLLTQQLGRPVVNGRRIANLLKQGAFDVINFHNVSLIGGPGLLKYGSATKIYVAHEHWLVCPTHVLWRYRRELCTKRECVRCQVSYRRPPQLWRQTGFLERQLHHVDAFVAVSEFSRQKHREFGFPRDMEVLPPFLPDGTPDAGAKRRDGARGRPYFLFVGRLERIKGLQDVIPVFREYKDADLLVAGDGDYASELHAIANGLERVHFLGRKSPEDLASLVQGAIAVVVPSVCYETFGIVVLEAFRQRTPVIARRLGPLADIVERSGGGELFSDEHELIGGIRRLQADPGHRDRLAAQGYDAFLKHWSETVVVPQYLDIVRRAADRKAGRPAIRAAS